MKICLITAFPPSRRGLNEYGFHLARELRRDPLLSLTVLADELDAPVEELPEFDVIRCWRFDALSNPLRLTKVIRDINPDVVWFNLLFSTFGNKPVPAFFGLGQPAISRLNGHYTHVTLHHLMDNINLTDSGVRFPKLYRTAGSVATRMLLMANSISVLLPVYRRTLIEKYRGENVHFRAHGILGGCPEPPDFGSRGNPEHRILAFGKWGTYKRVELLLEAFQELSQQMPNVRLIVAGGNHPATPGYIESVAESMQDNPRVEFTGYVEEEDIPRLFRSASALVLPYSSATGASGVAHLACEFGVPIISAGIDDFREMALDEGLAVGFYQTGSASSMAAELLALLNDSELMREMAEQNFSAALRMTMPQIIRQYLRSFDLQQRTRALEPISRFRRIPSWVPSRSAIFRAAAPRWQSWT
ncbi:MAG TPA: glycosyltransferase [Verrucomicrobiae bacterium]|jgi:glycosyltransferase involved in cell wall biosynthesis|nr:glycosyltransferase [Verrucomicrobiae bacterium]